MKTIKIELYSIIILNNLDFAVAFYFLTCEPCFSDIIKVLLENIHPMKKTIAEIMSYQVELRLPQTGMKPLPVFQRTNQLLQEIKLLENVTQEQNELLKVSSSC